MVHPLERSPATTGAASYVQWVFHAVVPETCPQGSVRAFFSGGPEVFPKAQSLVATILDEKKIVSQVF